MRILLFSHLRTAAGRTEIHLSCDDVDTTALWTSLSEACPELARFRSTVRLARNLEFTGPETRFYHPDEVALIPPVSGG
jgi:sulfur-carrier protein